MPEHRTPTIRQTRETIPELRKRLGLFSFNHELNNSEFVLPKGSVPELGVRPGSIVEWLVQGPGVGAGTCAFQLVAHSGIGHGFWALVDPAWECYVPAVSGWGIPPSRTLLIRPASVQETCWAIEQCLRCPGVSVTWAWIDSRIPERVRRRWQLAAEVGGGMGMFFRPNSTQREPAWADLRLLVTPQAGGRGDARRVRIDVLYRRGGQGGGPHVWEIDHAEGLVRLVPQVADPTLAGRAARA
jgi:protein ImuA